MFVFNGSTHLVIPSAAVPGVLEPFTMSMWVQTNTTQPAANEYLWNFGNTGFTSRYVGFSHRQVGTSFDLYSSGDATPTSNVSGGKSYDDARPTGLGGSGNPVFNLTVVSDGTTFTFYTNGTYPQTDTVDSATYNSGCFGALLRSSVSLNFTGKLGEIWCFHRALSLDELIVLWQNGVPAEATIPSGLDLTSVAGYWPGNADLTDQSGQGNDLTVGAGSISYDDDSLYTDPTISATSRKPYINIAAVSANTVIDAKVTADRQICVAPLVDGDDTAPSEHRTFINGFTPGGEALSNSGLSNLSPADMNYSHPVQAYTSMGRAVVSFSNKNSAAYEGYRVSCGSDESGTYADFGVGSHCGPHAAYHGGHIYRGHLDVDYEMYLSKDGRPARYRDNPVVEAPIFGVVNERYHQGMAVLSHPDGLICLHSVHGEVSIPGIRMVTITNADLNSGAWETAATPTATVIENGESYSYIQAVLDSDGTVYMLTRSDASNGMINLIKIEDPFGTPTSTMWYVGELGYPRYLKILSSTQIFMAAHLRPSSATAGRAVCGWFFNQSTGAFSDISGDTTVNDDGSTALKTVFSNTQRERVPQVGGGLAIVPRVDGDTDTVYDQIYSTDGMYWLNDRAYSAYVYVDEDQIGDEKADFGKREFKIGFHNGSSFSELTLPNELIDTNSHRLSCWFHEGPGGSLRFWLVRRGFYQTHGRDGSWLLYYDWMGPWAELWELQDPTNASDPKARKLAVKEATVGDAVGFFVPIHNKAGWFTYQERLTDAMDQTHVQMIPRVVGPVTTNTEIIGSGVDQSRRRV